MFKILLLEDDRDLNVSISKYLQTNGFSVTGCLNADDAFNELLKTRFDLIVSDIMLPGTDGIEFTESVRAESRDMPIIFISARDDYFTKKKGFRAGIDDYMVKPVDLEELLWRINALLRRARIADSKRLEIGDFLMDADAYAATYQGEPLNFTVKEFGILFMLLSYAGKTFTRSRIMEEFWSADSTSDTRTVDVYMVKIREKTKDCKEFSIQTVRGLGYKAVVNE